MMGTRLFHVAFCSTCDRQIWQAREKREVLAQVEEHNTYAKEHVVEVYEEWR